MSVIIFIILYSEYHVQIEVEEDIEAQAKNEINGQSNGSL